jgi:hypothetical protein
MKILYAANQRAGAHFQLNRFYQAAKDKHQIRFAAHKGQNYGCDIDWILGALYGVFDDAPNYAGIAMEIYREQIKQYAPDLIISDCEPITTKLANDLGIRVWQVSSLLLYKAFSSRGHRTFVLTNQYPSLFANYSDQMKELEKSERFIIYSHLCDLNLPGKYEWVRPYARIGETSSLYEHDTIAASIDNNKPLIHRLKQMDDIILFSEGKNERHPISLKPIDSIEYPHSIRNAKRIVVLGCEDLLADAFYNGKFAYMLPNFTDTEVMMSIIFNEYLVLGKAIYNIGNEKLDIVPDIEIERNDSVKSLDEELE